MVDFERIFLHDQLFFRFASSENITCLFHRIISFQSLDHKRFSTNDEHTFEVKHTDYYKG